MRLKRRRLKWAHAVLATAVAFPLLLHCTSITLLYRSPEGALEACEAAGTTACWEATASIGVTTLCCFPVAMGLTLLLSRRWSEHLRWAGNYLMVVYIQVLALAMAKATVCNGETSAAMRAFEWGLSWLATVLFVFARFFLQVLLRHRIKGMEFTMQRNLGAQRLQLLFSIAAILMLVWMILVALLILLWHVFQRRDAVYSVLDMLKNVITCLGYAFEIVSSYLVLRAFCVPLQQLRALDVDCQYVRRAKLVAYLQCAGVIVSTATSLLAGGLYVVRPLNSWFIVDVAVAFDAVANVFGVIVCSGVLQAKRKTMHDPEQFERDRASRRTRFFSAWKAHPDAAWHEKVQDLASRGFTIRALLDFYDNVKVHMPDFDPLKHTTADVTRHAVIPLTRDAGVPYASVMMGGVKCFPRTMVTHAWSGLFSDLVAAILAHALNESCYGIIAGVLHHDPESIRGLLEQAGRLDDTYWVCSFSVNQHRSICHDGGDNYPSCRCSLSKFLNDTPPLRADGRSIPCEMNKFADMMALLSSRFSDFQHLIVVDVQRKVFSRAWCMKEVHQGYCTGMVQSVLTKSAVDFTLSCRCLAHVEDMKASRPEDIKEILDSIPDKTSFNVALERLLFSTSGLLGRWLAGDTMMQMMQIGWLARWCPLVATCPPSVHKQLRDRLM